jgi:hypothetical protein
MCAGSVLLAKLEFALVALFAVTGEEGVAQFRRQHRSHRGDHLNVGAIAGRLAWRNTEDIQCFDLSAISRINGGNADLAHNSKLIASESTS